MISLSASSRLLASTSSCRCSLNLLWSERSRPSLHPRPNLQAHHILQSRHLRRLRASLLVPTRMICRSMSRQVAVTRLARSRVHEATPCTRAGQRASCADGRAHRLRDQPQPKKRAAPCWRLSKVCSAADWRFSCPSKFAPLGSTASRGPRSEESDPSSRHVLGQGDGDLHVRTVLPVTTYIRTATVISVTHTHTAESKNTACLERRARGFSP